MSCPPLTKIGQFMPLSTPKDDYTWTDADKSGLGIFGVEVLKVLLKYRVLNRQNMERVLQIKNKNKWKKDSLSKVLRGLRVSGHIEAYLMDATKLTVYVLSDEGIGFLQSKGMTVPEMQTGSGLIKDASETLKWISINQWHIGVLSQIATREVYYNQFMIGQVRIPSLVRYKLGKDTLSLFAYSAPRDGESINRLAEDIITAHHFVLEHPRFYPASYVIICESRTAAAYTAHQLTYIRQMRPLVDILYIFDEATQREHFMKYLYMYDITEDEFIKTSTDLTQGRNQT